MKSKISKIYGHIFNVDRVSLRLKGKEYIENNPFKIHSKKFINSVYDIRTKEKIGSIKRSIFEKNPFLTAINMKINKYKILCYNNIIFLNYKDYLEYCRLNNLKPFSKNEIKNNSLNFSKIDGKIKNKNNISEFINILKGVKNVDDYIKLILFVEFNFSKLNFEFILKNNKLYKKEFRC